MAKRILQSTLNLYRKLLKPVVAANARLLASPLAKQAAL